MERKGLWLGVKKCGCCDTAMADVGHTAQDRRDVVDRGLQLIYVTAAQWDAEWRDKFLADCPHEAVPA